MYILDKIKKWYKGVDPFELLAIVFIIIGIIAIILVFLSSSFNEFFDDRKHSINEYAELIGGFVGSLWALAGVLLFYASLASQQKDIEEQRNLLVRQIDEVVKQTDEFRKQSDIQAKQQYENTYFQLLRFHNDIITSIILEINDLDFVTGTNKIRQITGRKSFVEYYDIYKRFFNTQLEILMTGELNNTILQKIVDNSYRQFYDEYQADLGHYFRNLYNILYFIDNLEDDEKSKFYLELLHAQLSNYELALLYFHCACSSNLEFKSLLEKYEILSTLPDDEIISMSKKLYTPKAFGKDNFDDDDDVYSNDFGKDFSKDNGDDIGNEYSNDSSKNTKSDIDKSFDEFEISFSENEILSKFAKMTKYTKNNDFDEFSLDFNNFNDKNNKVENLSIQKENDVFGENIEKEESDLLSKLKKLSNSSNDEFNFSDNEFIDENYFLDKDEEETNINQTDNKVDDNNFDKNNDNNFDEPNNFEEINDNLKENMINYKDFENERKLNSNNLNLLNKIKKLPSDANFIENPEIEEDFDEIGDLNELQGESFDDKLNLSADILDNFKSINSNSDTLDFDNFNNFDEIENIDELKNISKMFNQESDSNELDVSLNNEDITLNNNNSFDLLKREEMIEKAKEVKLYKLSNLFTNRNK